MDDVKSREPLAIRAAVVALVDAVIHLVVLFGVSWTPEQTAQVSLVVNLASILAVVVWSRGKVTPMGDPDLAAAERWKAKHAAK